MDSNSPTVDQRIASLESTLRNLETRLAALESSPPSAATEPLPQVESYEPGPSLRSSLGLSLADFGRGFLIMAGAFMLRALANSEVLPTRIGVGLGLLYALLWIFMAGRSGADRKGHTLLYSGLSALIAFPLLWEAPTRFAALTPTMAASLLALVTAFAVVTAWRRRLRILAWIFTLSAVITSIGLLFATKAIAPFIGIVILLGLSTIWMGYKLKWHGLRWAPALSADALILFLVSISAREEGIPEAWTQISIGMAEFLAVSLLLVYLGSFVIRTLIRRRDVTHFEILQSAAALFIGFGGAARIAVSSGAGGISLGVAALLAAAACYFVSFVFVDRKLGHGKNFFFFTSLALVMVFLGSLLVLKGPALPLTWCALAIASAFLGGRYDRITLRMHSALYALAAFYTAGAMTLGLRAFMGPAEEALMPLVYLPYLVLMVAAGTYVLLVSTQLKLSGGELSRTPRFLILTITVFGIAGLLTTLAIQALATLSLHEAIRVAVLSLAAILLAAVGRKRITLEFSWLAYPVLILAGLKLLLVVLRGGNAITLFVGFAFFGVALILAPRFLRAAHWREALQSVDE
jgi:hypothetical protein